ncbi:MAG: ribbon-helix-helix domain-containing protein [Methanomassiliicoccaceae archaeon]|jgi:Arc/MetJ-type ribon-helix-helix transcriptional regulator|nr:hypothetical protein [Euryarchaeota archaeon]HOB37495.1 ribbon-helix-helix domain-containing protein [Methanomassiliicoccaceae archaeon]HQA21949.1 ribbon-helix-helix domain-containing protein [Methanomassiliicoccaceae archaeon]HQD87728.1 ribbon-helix-helix domain-containing protein [Methanomassiliicoccaceae archaeon]
MDGERISLRLEPDDLRMLDSFLKDHPEYSNRSHLARLAIRAFIEQNGASKDIDMTTQSSKETAVTVEVPALAYMTIKDFIRAGVYNSMEDAVVECLREKFITKEVKERILRQQAESVRTVEVLDR